MGKNGVDFLYDAIRFFAKIRALKDIVPQQYQDDVCWEKYISITEKKAIVVADFLTTYNTYDKIKNHFGEFRDIINTAFEKIIHIE